MLLRGQHQERSLGVLPLRHERSQEFHLLVLIEVDLCSEEVPEKELGKLGIDVDLLALDCQAVALMVKLVAKAMIPLDLSEVDSGELVIRMLLHRVEELGEALADLAKPVSRYLD